MTLPLRVRRFSKSTFFLNALYLMLSTFVVGAAGFVFWVLIARSYDAATVGLATTLLSLSGFISLLGLVGFDTTFIRFLPGSNRKSDYLSSGFLIVTFASAALALCVASIEPFVTSGPSPLSTDWGLVAFVFFTVVSSLNLLTNALFLAHKQARYILVVCIVASVFKVVAPLLVANGNVMTIFVLAGLAQLLSLVIGLAWLQRKFRYTFSILFDAEVLRMVRKFSFSTYASSILNLLPPTILPLMIVYLLGSANAAYYYMAFTLAGALYTIAYASMQSVFTEGSHHEAAIRTYVGKASAIIIVLLLPAAIVTFLLSNFLLSLFGHEYAEGAADLLRLFALGALPVAVYSAMGAIFKVTKNLRGIVSMNIIYAIMILGLSFWFVPSFGLIAVGWAWIIGNVAACCVGGSFLINKKLGG